MSNDRIPPPPRRAVRDMFRSTAEFAVVPAGDDLLTTMVLRAEAECDRLGWGSEEAAPLRWFWLHDNGALPNGMASIAMGVADMSEPLESLHPVALIEALEQHMVDVDRSLVGFILVNEGWMVRWRSDDPATRNRVLAAADRRELWRQPDREETRVATLQMLTGQTRSVMRIRGEETTPMPYVPLPVGDAAAVPAALYRLAVTLRRRKYGRRG